MKHKLPVTLLIMALTGMMLAGCGTAPEVPEHPQDSVVTESSQAGETTTPKEDVTPSEQPTQEPTSAVTPIDPTEVPEFTDAPVTTLTPTDIPEITEEPVTSATPVSTTTPEPTVVPEPTATIAPTVTVAPTATPKPTKNPWPTPTNIPIPTPGPTPSIRQIDGVKKKPIPFRTYKCGEKGEEVLALVKTLREEDADISPYRLVDLLSEEYEYSEQDILYGVYNSDWKEWCTEFAELQVDDGEFSKHRLLEYLGTYYEFIEEDLVYAVEHCDADWNEEAVESLELLLYGKYRSGTSYIYAVEFMKQGYYTDEQIEYAFDAIGEVDWEEQVQIKIKVYTEDSMSGVSYLSLIDRLVDSHDFDYEMSVKAVENIKDQVDWNAQAVKAAKYFAPYRSSREDLLHALTLNKFTAEQAEYAANKIGW